MINKCVILFCDNEHGTGDICFPDIDHMGAWELKQTFIKSNDVRLLRREAKKAGWSRIGKGDYCPACTESGV